MEFLKRIPVVFIVLMISAAIFYLLVNEEKKEDILRTTLEALGREALARVPDSPQKAALEQKLHEFINKAENNELSEKQIQITTASILNLGMETKKAPPEAIEAVIEAHIDSMRAPEGRAMPEKEKAEPPLNKRELAGEIRQMMALQKEIKRLNVEDSLNMDICEKVIFSADSGLKVWISPDIMEQHFFMHNREFLKMLHDLEQENVVRYYNFDQLNDLALLGLKFAAPFLSPKDEREIMAVFNQYPSSTDSLFQERIALHPDSIKKVIEIFQNVARQLEEKED